MGRYPERFIDSYCETFHNGLTVDERIAEARKGKTAVKQYVASRGGRVDPIGMGLEAPLPEEAWALIASLMHA
jgi:hypothetical protein